MHSIESKFPEQENDAMSLNNQQTATFSNLGNTLIVTYTSLGPQSNQNRSLRVRENNLKSFAPFVAVVDDFKC